MQSLRRSLAALLCIPVVALASATEDFEKNVEIVEGVMQQDLADQQEDDAEAALESQAEFFLDDGRTAATQEPQDPALAKYVTVTVGGKVYALTDVPIGVWFAPYVRDMAERGIVSGYRDPKGIPTGVFAPERGVSMEELAKMAIEAAHVTAECPAAPKNPLALKSWSAPYIACAEGHGFVLYADGTVDIHRSASRAEVVMTIIQAFGVPLKELGSGEQLYTDVSSSTLFAPAIKTASQSGIVSGYTDANGKPTGAFGPTNPVNRAEVSKMLSIALQVYSR